MTFNIETCSFDYEGLKESQVSKLYLCDMMCSNKQAHHKADSATKLHAGAPTGGLSRDSL